MFVFANERLMQWIYFSPHGEYAELVGIQRGYVTVASIVKRRTELPTMRDETMVAGVHIGDPYSAIPKDAANGAIVIDDIKYWFGPDKDGSTIGSIGEALTDAGVAKLAPLSQIPLLHDGSSFDDAVVVRASTDFLGIKFEEGYIAGHFSCKPGRVKKLKQSLVHRDGKSYDIMDVGCDNSDKTKSYYFDITDSFGKQ